MILSVFVESSSRELPRSLLINVPAKRSNKVTCFVNFGLGFSCGEGEKLGKVFLGSTMKVVNILRVGAADWGSSGSAVCCSTMEHSLVSGSRFS